MRTTAIENFIDARLGSAACAGGFWLGGTLFDHVRPDMRLYQEEIFGPVLCCVRVPDFASALQLINAHPFGNGVSCFSRDDQVAREFARRAQAGMQRRPQSAVPGADFSMPSAG